jgi:hypothetical protein
MLDFEDPRRRPRKRFIAIATVVLFVGAAVPLRAQTLPRADAALDSLIAERMADASIMGVAAAVIVDSQVVWMKGYGFADYERTRPFTPLTVMNVGLHRQALHRCRDDASDPGRAALARREHQHVSALPGGQSASS